MTAAETGLLEVLKEIYINFEGRGKEASDHNKKWLLSYTDEDGYTALHRASYNGHINVVEYLLSIGANVQSRTEDGWQPLHSACCWNKAEVASLLLQNEADINSLTNGSQTPLHLAACNATAKETLECLLWHEDCDTSIRNNNGETAEELALGYGKHGYLFKMKAESIDFKI